MVNTIKIERISKYLIIEIISGHVVVVVLVQYIQHGEYFIICDVLKFKFFPFVLTLFMETNSATRMQINLSYIYLILVAAAR